MLFGIDPLSMASLAVLAATPQRCELPKRTHIAVIPRTLSVKYDTSKTLSELQEVKSNSSYDLPPGLIGITHGLMRGKMSLSPRVSIAHKAQDWFGNTLCAWFDKIEVHFEVDPTIVIPKEVFDNPCMRREVTKHEQQHVKVDRELMAKYTKVIGDNIKATLDQAGYSSAPFEKEKLEGVIAAMQKTVYAAVAEAQGELVKERTELQAQVDSPEEYARLGSVCEDFNPRSEMRETKIREQKRNLRTFGGASSGNKPQYYVND